jgi:hypothetical protein
VTIKILSIVILFRRNPHWYTPIIFSVDIFSLSFRMLKNVTHALFESVKAVPLQAWSGPEVSRKLRFPDFLTTAQDGGKVVSLTYRPHLPQETFLVLSPDTLSKGKEVPLQAWSGPEGSRNLSLPDFMTKTQDGGKVFSLTHRKHLPPGNTPGTHFC